MKKLKVDEQRELLEYCKARSKKLSSELKKLGLSYDSLVYEKNRVTKNLSFPELDVEYKTLSDLKRYKRDMPVVSFFFWLRRPRLRVRVRWIKYGSNGRN